MRIVIDNVSPGLATSQNTMGSLRNYLEHLVNAMAAIEPRNEYIVLCPRWNTDFAFTQGENVVIQPLTGVPRVRMARLLYEQVFYPARIARSEPDVYLGTCNILPLALEVPSVVVVHHTQFYLCPEWYGRLRGAYVRRFTTWSVRGASAVVTVSETTRNEIIRYCGVAPEKIFTVHHGAHSDLKELTPDEVSGATQLLNSLLGPQQPYVVCVSSFYPFKNHKGLLAAFARLKRTSNLPHFLVLAGSETEAVPQASLSEHAANLGISRDVVFLGMQPRNAVRVLYAFAAMAVMPSFAETFGHPILEAMRMGCPVATSNTSCMPEIAGDAAELVDPCNVASICEGMRTVLTNATRRKELIERGRRRVSQFTFEGTAAKTLDTLKWAVGAARRA